MAGILERPFLFWRQWRWEVRIVCIAAKTYLRGVFHGLYPVTTPLSDPFYDEVAWRRCLICWWVRTRLTWVGVYLHGLGFWAK